jgi:hypothetical protein
VQEAMTEVEAANAQTLGEAMAYRHALRALTESVRSAAHALPPTLADQLGRDLAAALLQSRREFVFPAPPGWPADVAAAVNAAAHRVFSESIAGAVEALKPPD